MKVAFILTTVCALLLGSSALSIDENIVEPNHLLYDAIFDWGSLWDHFRPGIIPTIKAKLTCVEEYAQQDFTILRNGGEKVLQCLHTTQEEVEKLKASKFALKQTDNFRDIMQNCQKKINSISRRLDCYADAIAVYSKLVGWIKVPYENQTKWCVQLQLNRIESNLVEAGETFSQCVGQANAHPAPAPPTSEDASSLESSASSVESASAEE